MKKTVFVRALCLLFVLSFVLPLFVLGVSALDSPDVSGADYVYMKNLTKNKLIYEKNDGASFSPSSSAKLVMGMLALEMLSGRLDERVTIERYMTTGYRGASMYLDTGESLTVRELLYAAICGAYNDAAYVLAHLCCSDVAKFVDLMNARARELGAGETYFTNPTGYDDPLMRTTLEDIVIIARAAMNNEAYMEISSAVSKKIYIEGRGEFAVHNRNALIGQMFYSGYVNSHARGLIAGVSEVDNCVITAPVIDGDEYLCVVMRGREIEERILSYEIANSLIDYAKHGFANTIIMKADELICTIPVDFALGAGQDGEESVINVRTATDAIAFLPTSVQGEGVKMRYYLFYERLTAPTEAGTIVGGADFYLDGELICSVPLVINASLEQNTLLASLDSLKEAIASRTTVLTLIIMVSLLFLYFLSAWKRSATKRRNRAMKINISREAATPASGKRAKDEKRDKRDKRHRNL